MGMLAFIIGMLVGAWVTVQWGNHRAKYYKNNLERVVAHADALKVGNDTLVEEVQRLQRLKLESGREEYLYSIDAGILAAAEEIRDRKIRKIGGR